MKITQNEQENRFETTVDGHLAIVEYRLMGGRIAYTHTEVPKEIGGQGIGSQLAKHVLEYAREQQLSVLPYCPYIAAYIKKHPEYRDLVDKKFKEE